ncbi:MAG: DUF2807 domain-containing protein [Tannerellaceae bacterium]|jgi:hypothetical protein|nr:DUF2807 domain-containing protein [Tannerellaceae bacterium]
MKTKASVFLICMLALATTGFQAAGRTIKGNGKVETRVINISDYDEISLAGNVTFEYEQSDASPFLSITVDENIFEYIRAEVQQAKLSIGPRKENEYTGNSYNLNPTVFKVKSNSKNLKKVSKAGSGSFIVNSPLKIDNLNISSAGSGNVRLTKNVTGNELKISASGSGNLEISGPIKAERVVADLAGSGKVVLQEALSGNELKVSLAGSGDIKAKEITVEKLHCSLAGSGGIQLLDGAIKEASYSIAGSGNIKAYECKASTVKASLSGSGRLEIHASEALNASTAGSGSILYKGNPASVKESKANRSGTIRSVQ